MFKKISFPAFYTLFVYGAINSSIAVLLPLIIKDFRISYQRASLIFLTCALAAGFSSLIHGFILKKYRIKKYILIVSIVLAFALFGFSLSRSILSLVLLSILVGIGFSGIFLYANTVIARAYSHRSSNFLSALHLFMGLGSFLLPLGIPFLIKFMSWNGIFLLLFFAVILLIVLSQKNSYTPIETKEYSKIRRKDLLNGIVNKKTLYYSFLVFFYAAADLCLGIWLVTYLNKYIGLDYATASYRLSIYYILLMIGRILGFFIPLKIKKFDIVLVSAGLGALLLVVGIIKYPLLISFVSFFYSIIFPSIIGSAYADIKEQQEISLGIIFSFVSFGVAFAGFIVGFVSDMINLYYGFSASIVLIFITILLMVLKNKLIGGEKKARV